MHLHLSTERNPTGKGPWNWSFGETVSRHEGISRKSTVYTYIFLYTYIYAHVQIYIYRWIDRCDFCILQTFISLLPCYSWGLLGGRHVNVRISSSSFVSASVHHNLWTLFYPSLSYWGLMHVLMDTWIYLVFVCFSSFLKSVLWIPWHCL